jgi:hypothetical protein
MTKQKKTTKQSKAPKKIKRDHLFNSETDTCLFCGIHNEDAIMAPEPCPVATEKNIERAPLYEDN